MKRIDRSRRDHRGLRPRRCPAADSAFLDNEAGVAAVEFAFVLPLLLLLSTGIASFGHACILRYQMSSVAYDAARECTLARTAENDCAKLRVRARLETQLTAHCKKFDATGMKIASGFQEVQLFEVTVSCVFNGGVGLGYLTAHGVSLGTITTAVRMPY